MPEALTELERRILDYLEQYLRGNTYQPSIREIGRQFSIKSTKTVSELLQSLADKGWIERDPSRSRGVRLVGVDLHAQTVTLPVYRTPEEAPLGTVAIDRALAGNGGAFLTAMPDDQMSGLGMNAGDLLLVEAVPEAELAGGDVVYGVLRGEPIVRRLVQRPDGRALEAVGAAAPAPQPATDVRMVGRVYGLIRRIGAQRAEVHLGATVPA